MKRFLLYVLAAVVFCMLTACSGNSDGSTVPSTESAQFQPSMPEEGTDPGGFGPIF